MNRRAFFGAAAAIIPASAALAAQPPRPSGLRVSFIPGDPGEALVGKAHIDYRKFHVFLDGVEQGWWHTADEAEGFVLRDVKSPDGQPALNPLTHEWVRETMYGKVEIVFEDKAWLAKAVLPSVA